MVFISTLPWWCSWVHYHDGVHEYTTVMVFMSTLPWWCSWVHYHESPWYNCIGWLGVKHQLTYTTMMVFMSTLPWCCSWVHYCDGVHEYTAVGLSISTLLWCCLWVHCHGVGHYHDVVHEYTSRCCPWVHHCVVHEYTTLPLYKTKDDGAFSHFGPSVWNSLPPHIRNAATISTLETTLKTNLFNLYKTNSALLILMSVCACTCMHVCLLSLIHIWRCRRAVTCRSRWSPYH